MNQVGTNPLVAIAEFGIEQPTDGIPNRVESHATRALVDLFGTLVAGAGQADVTPLRRYLEGSFASGKSTALGMPGGWVAECATYLNAAAGHALDFDDHNDTFGGHPTVVVLPPVLALAEELGAPMREAVAAYIIGVEAEMALGKALNPIHYERGWHPTATLGIFGATIAASRLLGAGVDSATRALAIASSFSSGLKGSFGSFMKPLQVGFATSKAISAARLAENGVTANTDVFQRAYSFPQVFDGTREVDWTPVENLGTQWNLDVSGLDIKLYPCCVSTQSCVEAALALRADPGLDAASIEVIDVYVHPRRTGHIDNPVPRTGTEARFSVQYVVALALLRGAVTLDDFTDARIGADDEVRALQARVRLHELEPAEWHIPEGRSDSFATRVVVTDAAGTHSRSVRGHRGYDTSTPIDDGEVMAKFHALAGPALGRETASRVLASLLGWNTREFDLHRLFGEIQQAITEAPPHTGALQKTEVPA